MEKANVCPIFKKDNPCKPNNYRLISLLNYEGKIMERCVHKHISKNLEENSTNLDLNLQTQPSIN